MIIISLFTVNIANLIFEYHEESMIVLIFWCENCK